MDYLLILLEQKSTKCNQKTPKNTKSNIKKNIEINFTDGPVCTIHDLDPSKKYLVEFIDRDSNKLMYKSTVKVNQWARASQRYFTNWLVRITVDNKVIFKHFACSIIEHISSSV